MNNIYKKSNNIVVRKIENEIAILPLGDAKDTQKDCLFCLEDPTSVRIWELLDGKRNVNQIIEEIAVLFNIEKDKIKNDVTNFISELRNNELVVPST